MRILLIKIILRLLSDNSTKQMKDEVVQEWLMSLSDDKCGYSSYYTIRKKAILGALAIGIEQKEYWINIGRLMELKQLNFLSNDLIKKYDKRKQVKKKRKKEI